MSHFSRQAIGFFAPIRNLAISSNQFIFVHVDQHIQCFRLSIFLFFIFISLSPRLRLLRRRLILCIDGTTIKSISENVIADPGEEATLSCTVEGKPLTEEHVRWERIGYNMKKTEITFVNGTSYLHIKNAQRADVGNFRCVADNRVANPTSRDVLLIVKCKFSSPRASSANI